MKKLLLVLAAMAMLTACADNSPLRECSSFEKALPVWAEGRQTEENLNLAFREVINVKGSEKGLVRITAHSDYRLKVNGNFVSHGPCVAAEGFYRIDAYDISGHLKKGDNIITVEVAGYNQNTYYLTNEPSFLQAEVVIGGKVVAATGEQFTAYELGQRKQDAPRFSYQRPSLEWYVIDPSFNQWTVDVAWNAPEKMVKQAVQQTKNLLPRHVLYPEYDIVKTVSSDGRIFKFAGDRTGFLGMKVSVKTPSKVEVIMDEVLDSEGNPRRLWRYNGKMVYELAPGEYELEAFEPNCMMYVVIKGEGDYAVSDMYLREYCGADASGGTFECSDERINRIFQAGRETHRQNALDVFMDCPHRERAGWLCDSYFSARVAYDLSGRTRVEDNFIENYLLPESFTSLEEFPGMIPMCYPSSPLDDNRGTFIPNWAMWFVLELEEYYHRSGNREMVDAAKDRVYGLKKFFDGYLNEYGLLEKLPSWVFVEWSPANDFVQDVNFPSNMLYAAMLDAIANLYDDEAVAVEAAAMRHAIRRLSFDGEMFCDNAVRNEAGELVRTANRTETCQYYAFYFETATPEIYPVLWDNLRTLFGPGTVRPEQFRDVYRSEPFVGNYLRLECLSREGYCAQLLNDAVNYFMPMVEVSGTLWEKATTKEGSLNHGFASHVIRIFNRDALGLYSVDELTKTITLRFCENGLQWCKGSVPVADGAIKISWNRDSSGELKYDYKAPKGYDVKVIE